MSANKILQAAAGNAAGGSVYVEDVFSTDVWVGNDNVAFDITNDIDLDGEGGMVWIKSRNTYDHNIFDTERGANIWLESASSLAQQTATNKLNTFNNDGYSLGTNTVVNGGTDKDYVGWSFRKQEGFFDVVTYTGNGTSGRGISHNLGSTPGFVIVKCTSDAEVWRCFHRTFSASNDVSLNSTAAVAANGHFPTVPDSDNFYVGAGNQVNGSGKTYVAYLFAHDDQSFGDDSDESIIKCGSYTGTGSSGNTIDLGFEPQWILLKETSGTGSWAILDVMRGFSLSDDGLLKPNTSDFESFSNNIAEPTATGFTLTSGNWNTSSDNYIYVAIRRPMKTPEAGTEVFKPVNQTGGSFVTTGFPVDLLWNKWDLAGQPFWWNDRIRGAGLKFLRSDGTDREDSYSTNYMPMDYNNGVEDDWNSSGDQTYFAFRRATGFFDTVCYVADQTSSHNHNLAVTPEFAIIKQRNGTNGWKAYHSYLGNNQYLQPHTTNAAATDTGWASVNASTFFLKANNGDNIAYLWATVAGVSKVGSVVHSGTTNVDCGFSAGARFVLIKRTDSTGGWYVYDSARGIVAGNDPYYLLDDTAVEVTNTDYIDPLNAGFTLTSSFTAGTYIFLAIA